VTETELGADAPESWFPVPAHAHYLFGHRDRIGPIERERVAAES
jgi:hypothetical protein